MSKPHKKEDLFGNKIRVDEFDERCAHTLVKAIQKIRKTTRRTKINKWIPQFEKLRTLDSIEKERIKDILNWYILHLKDRYVPEIYSADGFRNKFFQIEAAKEREEGDRKEEDDFEVDEYKEGKSIIRVIHYDDD